MRGFWFQTGSSLCLWFCSRGFGCRGCFNEDDAAFASVVAEAYCAVDQGIERVIATHAHILAGIVDSATLTNEHVACYACLATPNLYAEPFAVGLATVLRTTNTFFVCHFYFDFRG